MRGRSLLSLVLAIGLLCLIGPAGAAARLGMSVVAEGPIDHDLYLAGPSVEVRAEVDGDVIAAGGRVSIGDDIAGSVMAAGGAIEVRGVVRRAIRAVGGDIDLGAQVGRDLAAAGASVQLRREGHVAGNAWIAGGYVAIAGSIDRDLDAAGDDVVISGKIGGDVTIRARSIRLLSGAAIQGRLVYESTSPAEIDPRATVTGGIEHHEWKAPRRIGAVARAAYFAGSILFALGSLVAGLLWVLVFPGYSLNAARLVAARPLASLGLGFAILVATPVAALVAILTVLGAMLGALVLALYCATLLLAMLTAAIFLGDALLRLLGRGYRSGPGRRLGALFLGVILLAALAAVPILGVLVLLAAVCFGLGGFFLEAAERY